MKRLVFATQVFFLVAIFPVCLVAQLNYGNDKTGVKRASHEFVPKADKSIAIPAVHKCCCPYFI